MIEDIFSFTKSLNFMNENKNLKYFTNVLTSAMLYSLKKEKYDIYDDIFDNFKKLTIVLCKIPKGFSDVLVYYALMFNEIKEKNYDKVEEFIENIFDETYMLIDDSKFVEFKYYCISEMVGDNSEVMKKKVRKYHIETLLNTIEMKDKYKGYMFIPNFEKSIKENQYQLEEIGKVCSEINILLNKSIVSDNILAYSSFLDVISSCLKETEMQSKEIQFKLFDLYIYFINRTAWLTNRQYSEVLFSKLTDTLFELDAKRNISHDFSMYIINGLAGCAKYGQNENNFVILCVIDLFREIMKENKEVYFICISNDRKKALYRGLFNIGTCCVENDFEEGLRSVSNTLGWFLIYNIKQNAGQLATYLIERASELYSISKKMDVTEKTQTFLLTLFTTVGTYCCKDNKNGLYLQKIFECIKYEKKEKVITAIKLRTSENDMWNELYEKQTDILTKKFIKAYEEFNESKVIKN